MEKSKETNAEDTAKAKFGEHKVELITFGCIGYLKKYGDNFMYFWYVDRTLDKRTLR